MTYWRRFAPVGVDDSSIREGVFASVVSLYFTSLSLVRPFVAKDLVSVPRHSCLLRALPPQLNNFLHIALFTIYLLPIEALIEANRLVFFISQNSNT